MSEHVAIVVDGIDEDCFERECEHEGEDECPSLQVTTCKACYEAAGGGENWVPIPDWPCLYSPTPAQEPTDRRQFKPYPEPHGS